MDFSKVFEALAPQGVLGVMFCIVLYALYKKDAELKAERDARVTDAKAFTDRAIDLQERVIDAVNKLSDILEETKKLAPGRFR